MGINEASIATMANQTQAALVRMSMNSSMQQMQGVLEMLPQVQQNPAMSVSPPHLGQSVDVYA